MTKGIKVIIAVLCLTVILATILTVIYVSNNATTTFSIMYFLEFFVKAFLSLIGVIVATGGFFYLAFRLFEWVQDE